MKHPLGVFADDGSADSSAGFPDRASMMEVRLQAQEDEITLLKSSLADALRRIRLHDQLLPLLKQQLIAGESLQYATTTTLQLYDTLNLNWFFPPFFVNEGTWNV